MASKKRQENKLIKRIVVIILIFIAIICIIIHLSLSSSSYKAQKELKYIISEEWHNELYPKGMPELIRKYSGDLKAQNIGKSIYYVATELIPYYHEKLKGYSENKIYKYLKKNKDAIIIDIGTDDSENFKKMITEIQNKAKTQKLEFESYYIDEDSIVSNSELTEAEIYIKYKNCEEIELKLNISNRLRTKKSSILYLAK